MSTALSFLSKLERVDYGLSAQIAMEETAEVATFLQKDQLFQGIDKRERPITNQKTGSDEYSPSYAKKKGRSKPIDLHDQGDYYAGIGLDVRGVEFVMFSADIKAPKLGDTYNALGLTPKSKSLWGKNMKPVFIREIKTYLR